MESYIEMKERHQREISNFPMQFAFGKEQFEKAMKKLGLSPEDTDKVCSLYGAGDIMLKDDAPKYYALIKRHRKELKDAIAADATGEFMYGMFDYELSNYEFGYTQDPTNALEALGITWGELNANSQMQKVFAKVCKEQVNFFNEINGNK
ncbi:DUF7659 family protein [Anaerotignum lactatifermentans]|uniref:DUF7659 family protein n=1 Tax=Anaerotignum lactatifermentans TaxID=160404 RepID=UPI00174CAE9D|nr:hypothetical protein [Anaerotignum lactatifermentans]